MTLEIELGVTGGEEDGVDNTDIDDSKLYTQPDEVAYAYEQLSEVSKNFTIAAAASSPLLILLIACFLLKDVIKPFEIGFL